MHIFLNTVECCRSVEYVYSHPLSFRLFVEDLLTRTRRNLLVSSQSSIWEGRNGGRRDTGTTSVMIMMITRSVDVDGLIC